MIDPAHTPTPPEADPATALRPPRRRSGSPRPSDEDMLDAACAVFAESGFHAAKMDTVAARAGSTKPTLYTHFGSKEQLYRKCTERAAASLAGGLFKAYSDAAHLPLERQVRAGMVAFFGYATAHPARFRLLFGDRTTGAALEARQQLMAAATDRIAQLIRDFTERHGREPWGPSAELCACFVVGLTVEGARYALAAESPDATVAGEFATSFAVAALRHIDPRLATAIDHGGS